MKVAFTFMAAVLALAAGPLLAQTKAAPQGVSKDEVVIGSIQDLSGRALTVLVGQAARYQKDLRPQLGVPHRIEVAAAPLGRAGCPLPVHVRDPPMAEADQVFDRKPSALDVVGPDDIDGARAQRAGHDHHW